jgi:membrane protein DedA with SNARE-associated domain
MIGMSEIKTAQFLLYSVVTGLLWASTVSIVGYAAGRFFDVTPVSLEQNLLFIVLGFFLFGLLVGYFVKRLAEKRMGV